MRGQSRPSEAATALHRAVSDMRPRTEPPVPSRTGKIRKRDEEENGEEYKVFVGGITHAVDERRLKDCECGTHEFAGVSVRLELQDDVRLRILALHAVAC